MRTQKLEHLISYGDSSGVKRKIIQIQQNNKKINFSDLFFGLASIFNGIFIGIFWGVALLIDYTIIDLTPFEILIFSSLSILLGILILIHGIYSNSIKGKNNKLKKLTLIYNQMLEIEKENAS